MRRRWRLNTVPTYKAIPAVAGRLTSEPFVRVVMVVVDHIPDQHPVEFFDQQACPRFRRVVAAGDDVFERATVEPRQQLRMDGAEHALDAAPHLGTPRGRRSEEHTSELQSLMRISYAVFCLKKKKEKNKLMQITTS